MRYGILVVSAAIALSIFAQTVTFFVIQPIGAIPDGVTVLMWRVGDLQLFDSPDAICERKMSGVSLFCRGIVAGKVASEASIIARLPYSQWLYELSTGGKTYDR
jgi:hypothetical protein